MGTADELFSATLAGLPRDHSGFLVAAGRPRQVFFARVQDVDWLDEQIRLQEWRWPTVDRRELATLWWYSISHVFLTPTLASLFVTGQALSPIPRHVELNWLPGGRIFTARSTAVLQGADGPAVAANALRESLEVAIPAIARAGGMRSRPLWAIATDSLANRLLWLGRARGEVERASALATSLVELIGAPMPAPRFIDVARTDPEAGTARFVRRCSCCLVYREPGASKCVSCPRLTPDSRAAQLRSAADQA